MTAPTTNLSTDLDRAAKFARDEDLAGPLAAAIARAAVEVMAEDATTVGHQLRTNLARQVLQDPMMFVPRFAWAVSVNNTIVKSWTDELRDDAVGGFQFQVDAVWDAMSGVAKDAAAAPAPPAV